MPTKPRGIRSRVPRPGDPDIKREIFPKLDRRVTLGYIRSVTDQSSAGTEHRYHSMYEIRLKMLKLKE